MVLDSVIDHSAGIERFLGDRTTTCAQRAEPRRSDAGGTATGTRVSRAGHQR